jgi:hypothetical protein
MARQMLKGLTLMVSIVGLALVTAVNANGQGNNLKAHIPFDFIANNKDLRAGDYNVRMINSPAVLIESADSNARIVSLTNRSESARNDDTQARLVFHRYGSTYFLSQVWMGGETSGRELVKTKRERAAEREARAIASNHGSNEPLYEVVVVTVR